MSISLVNEVYIAVIGFTGTGKTSLISALQGLLYERPKESCSLKPDSVDVNCTWIRWPQGGDVRFAFLDTPGFNGDEPNEGAVLKQIRSWLASYTQNSAKLAGILYLSSIQSQRPTELKVKDTLKNVTTYKSLCGDDPFAALYLTTTFWDRAAFSEAEQREEQLLTTIWSPIIKRGGHMIRYKRDVRNPSRAAWSALDDFLYASLERQAREEVGKLRSQFEDPEGKQLLDDWERIISQQRMLKEQGASDVNFEALQAELQITVDRIRVRREGAMSSHAARNDHGVERLSKLSLGLYKAAHSGKAWINTKVFRRTKAADNSVS